MTAALSFAALLAVAAAAPIQATSPVTAYPAAFFAASQPTTALDMVDRLPGFTFDRGAAVRGLGGAAGNVLIDGARPAAKDDGLYDILKRIPAASVLRIELIRGGAPGIDMQGRTVLANIVRRRDGGLKLTVAAAGAHWYDGRLGWGGRIEGARRLGDTAFEFSLFAGSGIDDRAGNGARRQIRPSGAVRQTAVEHSEARYSDYKATGSLETPVAGGVLKAHASLDDNPYNSLQDDRLASSAGENIDRQHTGRQITELGLNYTRRLNARTGFEAVLLQQLGRSRYTDAFVAPGDVEFYDLKKTSGESIARATFRVEATPAISLQAGAEGDFNWVNAATRFVQNGAPVSLPAANVRVTETRAEGFATAAWRVSPRLSVEGGLRLEASRISSTGDVMHARTLAFPKPRLQLTWSPDAADQVRVRLEREVGQLNFDDFASGSASLANGAVRAGNPDLSPQQAWVAEAAYERRFWGAGAITITLRHARLSQVIDRAPIYDPSGTFDAPGNIGGGRKDELGLALTLPTDRLGLRRGLLTGQATWRFSSVTDPTTGLTREISGLHPTDAELHFTQGLPRLKASWGFDLFDQWRETYYRFNEIDTDQLKTYVSLYAEYKPNPNLSLRFELENAGGRGFNHLRQVYLGPRNVAGVDYNDVRDLHTGRGLYFRVRHTFG